LALVTALGATPVLTPEQAHAIADRPHLPMLGAFGDGPPLPPSTSVAPPMPPSLLGVPTTTTTVPAHLASDPFVQAFEPPHIVGRTFAFFVDDQECVWRIVVDTDTLNVERTAVGPYYRKRQPIPGGRAYVDDAGTSRTTDAVILSSLSSPTANRWLEQGLFEHASIASFARSVLELMAVGAPLDLLERSLQAALDEVRHTQQCFTLARRFGADVGEPGPLPALLPRPGSRADVGQWTRAEAAEPESDNAARASAEADVTVDDEVRAVLREQADDEARHAALAWDIVDWAGAQ
jgi:hypothetical protein